MYVRKWNTWSKDPRTGPRFSAFYWSKCGSSFLFSRYGSGAISGSLIWTLLPSRQCRPKQFHWALVVCSFLTSLGRLLEKHEILNNNVFDLTILPTRWCKLRWCNFKRLPLSLSLSRNRTILTNYVRRSWSPKWYVQMMCSLTMRKTAARSVTLHFTLGKVTPKLSASVNASFSNPDHFFVIRPIFVPSFVKILIFLTQHE